MMMRMLQLARSLPRPLHIILTAMTNGAITAVDPKPEAKPVSDESK